jgi:hypothetical protein
MGSTTSTISLVGISAIVPSIGVPLLVARILHHDTGKVIDGGVDAVTREAVALGRAGVRKAAVATRSLLTDTPPVELAGADGFSLGL